MPEFDGGMTADFLSFPEADDVFWVTAADGARLPVYALAGAPSSPALLFGHANGFAAGSYAPWLRALARHARVFAFDARGHGGSHWPEGPLEDVFCTERFAADLGCIAAAVTARLDGEALAYVGHSLGAAAAPHLAVSGGAPRWTRAVFFEPPIFPPPTVPGADIAAHAVASCAAGAARRRADWPSPDAFFDRLKGRGPFAHFTDAMLRAHCRATLKPNASGSYTLACPPSVEAAIYLNQRDTGTWRQASGIETPMLLVSGDPTLSDRSWISLVIGALVRQIPHARLSILPGTGHLMLFEQPHQCLELVCARLREVD